MKNEVSHHLTQCPPRYQCPPAYEEVVGSKLEWGEVAEARQVFKAQLLLPTTKELIPLTLPPLFLLPLLRRGEFTIEPSGFSYKREKVPPLESLFLSFI